MTISEIASKAGVSVSTVSKVLNNKDTHISEKTRDLIMGIARDYNYTPYQKVFNNMSVKVTSIAVIITDVSDVFCSELLKGVEDYFFNRKYNVIICNTYGSSEKEQEYIKMLKEKNIQGIISFPDPGFNNDFMSELSKENIQCVILDNYKQIPNVMKSYFNNEEGGYLACKHLVESGHTSVGYITRNTNFPYLAERFGGYKRGLSEGKIDFDENLVYTSDSFDNKEVGFLGAKYLLSQGVSAIFCCDDRVAVGAYNAILETELKIPDDVSIIGFDDSIICELLNPKLTSVRQSAYDIGFASANMLYNKLNNLEMEIEDVQIEPQLIVRESANKPSENSLFKNEKIVIIGNLYMNTVLKIIKSNENETTIANELENILDGYLCEKFNNFEKNKNTIYAIGRVGNDFNGKNVYEEISKMGIKTDGIVFDENLPTGTKYTILSEDEIISTVIHRGANDKISVKQIEDLEWIFDRATTCIIDGVISEEIKKFILKQCEKKNVKVRN